MPFCSVPFIHSYVDTKGKNRICCAAEWTPGQYDLQDWESKDYQKIREAVSSDDKEWLPECNECKRREEAGQEDSYRKINNKLYEQLDRPELNIINGTNFEVPISYDLRMNNLCNLSCRMCGPSTSSQLYKEMIRHPELWTKSTYEPLEAYNSMDINRIIDEAESMYEIKLLGGEPTVQPETKAIMKRLIDVGNTGLRFNITTNGTNVNTTFYDLLKQFKQVYLQISIDDYGIGHDYIRGPASNFETIWKNIKKIYELDWAGDINIAIHQTITTFNIFNFWELRQQTNIQYPWCGFRNGIVYYPPMYSPQYLPGKWKDMAAEVAKKAGAYEDEKHIFKLIYQVETNMNYVRELKNYTPIMDFARNQHLKDYFPQFAELFEGIN